MLSQQIRRQFLKYFKDKKHTIVPSSPVVPHDDPSLLFINAGMNQFKDVFLGKSKREYTRAVTTQKCIRVGGKHNDLENVGHTSRHLTFFEMLGNFSFGDYFKKEAIAFAWDVATNIFELDPEKIWVSVFESDDEAFSLWQKHVPVKRIVRFGEKENFWAMGDTGPCGPCSELLFDRGSHFGAAIDPTKDPEGERFFEFWNLVFMQFSRDSSGNLTELPKKSIDTGAGLERVVSLKENVQSVFEIDLFQALIRQIEKISKQSYKKNPAFHVIADHIRSLSFAIADGVQPSNTDRGYVLRKILRRAVRYGRSLGMEKPFLAKLVPELISLMGDDFEELKIAKDRIEEILTLEEEAFLRTLSRGGQLLSQVIERSKKQKIITGEDAFKLKDTYGLPLEEIELIAKDEEMKIDHKSYEKLEKEAKEKSRGAKKQISQEFHPAFFAEFASSHSPCVFEGYDKTEMQAKIIGIIVEQSFKNKLGPSEEGIILLDKTCFYPEMGGQIADMGKIDSFEVEDCKSPYPGVIAHFGVAKTDALSVGQKVHLKVDAKRRRKIACNHSATHLLHWALQKVLGEHIKQAGSLVDDERLRFDFNHHKALKKEELKEIEKLVNEKIRENSPIETYELSFEEAQKKKEIKQFFGDKYGEKVRVVDIDFSKELCGGTHARQTGDIGLFKITKESSIAAGVRRIEALTARAAEEFVEEEEALIEKLAIKLKTTPSSLLEQVDDLIEEGKALARDLKKLRKEKLEQLLEKTLSTKEKVGPISLILAELPIEPSEINECAQMLMQKMKSGVIALGLKEDQRCQIIIAVSPDLAAKEISALDLIKKVAPFIQGGGGGRQTLAQAGGKDAKGLQKALEQVRVLLQNVAE